MEISNFSLLNTHSDKPTKLNTKTSAVDDRNYASVPSVSPAYYSPSFMGKKKLNHSKDNTYLKGIVSLFYRAMSMNKVPEDMEKNYFGIYNFLRDESEYTDGELEGICRVLMSDINNKELSFILPEFNKKAFTCTMDEFVRRMNETKDIDTKNEILDNYNFIDKYNVIDRWVKTFDKAGDKYSPEEQTFILNSLLKGDNNSVPECDKQILEITMNQYNALKENSGSEKEVEDYDFRKEYIKNLKKFSYEDDGIICPRTIEDKFTTHVIRQKYEDRVGIGEEYDLFLKERNISQLEMEFLLRSWNIETERNRDGIVIPKRKPSVAQETDLDNEHSEVPPSEEQTTVVEESSTETDTPVEEADSSETRIYSAYWQFLLFNCTECGNNNVHGPIDSFLIEPALLKAAGINTVIDVREKRSSIREEDGVTFIGFDMSGPTSIWANHPAFLSKAIFESSLKQKFDETKKYLSSERIKETLDYNEECVRDFDKDSREFIDKFVTVISHLNKGGCVFGCTNGCNDTSNMMVFDHYFNPKSHYEYNPMESLSPEKNVAIISGVINLYKKLTPEDKKKMGWDDKFDKNFMNRVAEDIQTNINNKMAQISIQSNTI